MICYGTNTKSGHSLMMNDALKLFLIKIITGQMLKAPWGVAISTMNFADLDPELPRPYHAGEIFTLSERTGPPQCQ